MNPGKWQFGEGYEGKCELHFQSVWLCKGFKLKKKKIKITHWTDKLFIDALGEMLSKFCKCRSSKKIKKSNRIPNFHTAFSRGHVQDHFQLFS